MYHKIIIISDQNPLINSATMPLQKKLLDLQAVTAKRKSRLNASSEYLQFNWKADLVDSWISESIDRTIRKCLG